MPNHKITAMFQVTLVPGISYVLFGVSGIWVERKTGMVVTDGSNSLRCLLFLGFNQVEESEQMDIKLKRVSKIYHEGVQSLRPSTDPCGKPRNTLCRE